MARLKAPFIEPEAKVTKTAGRATRIPFIQSPGRIRSEPISAAIQHSTDMDTCIIAGCYYPDIRATDITDISQIYSCRRIEPLKRLG